MFKMRIGLLVCTLLVPTAVSAADLPKDGTFKTTFFATYVQAKRTTLPTANGETAAIDEATFTYINDAGSGFMHRATGRCLISLTYSAAGFHSVGPCTYADADGDLIFSTFDLRGTANQAPIGTKEYIGGTGKYTGLTGHADFTTAVLKPVEGTPGTIEGHVQGSYKLAASATK